MECVVWVVEYGSENAEEQGNKRERPSEQPPKKKKRNRTVILVFYFIVMEQTLFHGRNHIEYKVPNGK